MNIRKAFAIGSVVKQDEQPLGWPRKLSQHDNFHKRFAYNFRTRGLGGRNAFESQRNQPLPCTKIEIDDESEPGAVPTGFTLGMVLHKKFQSRTAQSDFINTGLQPGDMKAMASVNCFNDLVSVNR